MLTSDDLFAVGFRDAVLGDDNAGIVAAHFAADHLHVVAVLIDLDADHLRALEPRAEVFAVRDHLLNVLADKPAMLSRFFYRLHGCSIMVRCATPPFLLN